MIQKNNTKDRILFNPGNEMVKEILGPAMKIDNKADAERYFNDYVDWMMSKYETSREYAEDLAVVNLKRYSMFYDMDVIERMNNVFEECFQGYYDRYAR